MKEGQRVKMTAAEVWGEYSKPDVAEAFLHHWKSTETAFEKFGLDIQQDGHWKALTVCLSHVIFGSRRGAPPRWTESEYRRLLQDFDQVRRRHPSCSYKRCSTILAKAKVNSFYNGLSAETLRKNERIARKLKRGSGE
jgi:hypothetical protein